MTFKIDVCFASDDNYTQHLAVVIASILKNSSENSKFYFHILDGGIRDKNKQKLLKLQSIKPFNYNFYDMSKFDFSQLPLNRDYISVATYYRLFILDILPESIEKLIYLDCDVVVKEDLKKLYDINIDNYLAGVVEDEGSISQIHRLRLPLENNYFNAGVIVFNLKELRKYYFKEKCFDYYTKNQDSITLQDQDILNGVFNGKCKFIPLCWNANGRLFRFNELEHHYTEKDEIIARSNPAIIHYTDVEKPWKVKCNHPLQLEYFKYKWFTPYRWKGVVDIFSYKLIQNIFSIKNKSTKDKKIKILTILGIKIKFKSTKAQ